MSYTVYIILVTVLHVVYLSVQMGLDLFMSTHTAIKKDVETFDVSNMHDEAPVIVNEVSQDGEYRMGNELKESEKEKEGQSNVPKQESEDKAKLKVASERPLTEEEQKVEEQNKLYDELTKKAENCLRVEPEYESLYSPIEFEDAWVKSNIKHNMVTLKQVL